MTDYETALQWQSGFKYDSISCHTGVQALSEFFLKWCSRGVVKGFPNRKNVDFPCFFGFCSDIAVADEKDADW